MDHPWPELKWWSSQDYQNVLTYLEAEDDWVLSPRRDRVFSGLADIDCSMVRVLILGQDPYPDNKLSTGTAFSIPKRVIPANFPRTLRTIYKEYADDLKLPVPSHGCLRRWTDQGVLLLNAIPSLGKGGSLSHDWKEYHSLTREIVETLQQKGIVFAFLGSVARRFEEYVTDDVNNRVICTSHPSPRGNLNSKTPFTGSRLFSTINSHLNAIGLEPIDWSLDVPAYHSGKEALQGPSLDRTSGRLLSNTSGTDLGKLKSRR